MASPHLPRIDSVNTALKHRVENDTAYTGSLWPDTQLEDWSAAREKFLKVMPMAYERAISERPEADARRMLPASAAVANTVTSENAD